MDHTTASMAAAYVQRGWKVIQLHDVTAGACSCVMATHCGSAGKHPLANAWQANFIADVPTVYAAWAARPQANVGVVTGPPSGIWVLDIDPAHDGHLRLAELVAAHGPIPDTYTVSTGSGGTHYYFGLSPVDFDLTNSQGGFGKFPKGIDVRGRGGFVVAPPSVSSRGAYRILSDPDSDIVRYL